MRTPKALAGTILVLAAAALPAPAQESTSWRIYADAVYTASGEPIEGGIIVVENGRVASLTPGGRAKVADDSLNAVAVTPGMIDASVRLNLGAYSVEQSQEQVASIRVAEALDVFDERWASQARSGVTTALACPTDNAVVGGMGIVLKTAGEPSLAARTIRADAVLRAAIGTQPSAGNRIGRPLDFYVRRPTTRMGVEWTLRKSFYDAAYSRSDPSRAFDGSTEMLAVLDGATPIVVQAWATQDIRTAVFWKEEMEREGLGRPRLIVDAAAEAWKEPDLLVRSGAAVVLPPYPADGRSGDRALFAADTAMRLHELGVPLALSAHGDSTDQASLARQVGFAMRGGLPFEAALAAVTTAPARLLGVDDRVGTIEVGREADLVLWNGRPFEFTSSVIGVLIDGRLILDPRD